MRRRSAPALSAHAVEEMVDAARKYLWRSLPLINGALAAAMQCIASHAEDIIRKATWQEYELAKLIGYKGAHAPNLTPAMAYLVLTDGISHAAVQRVRHRVRAHG